MPNCIALFTKLQHQRGCHYVKPRPALKCADAVAIGPKLAVEKFGIEQKVIMLPDPYPVDVDDVVGSCTVSYTHLTLPTTPYV